MSLGFPAKVKYISMKNQRHERIWATRVVDRQLIDVTPLDGERSLAKLEKERNRR